jgi:hypothetical protein
MISDDGLCSMVANDDLFSMIPDDHGRAMVAYHRLCTMIANDDLLSMVPDDYGRAMIPHDRHGTMVADHHTATVAVTSHRSFVHGDKCQTGREPEGNSGQLGTRSHGMFLFRT